MRHFYPQTFCILLLFAICILPASAQPAKDAKDAKITKEKVLKANPVNHDLFNNDEILHLTLRGDIKSLLKDRKDKSTYYPINLSYNDPSNKKIEIETKLKTRGHFRKMRGNCYYPPLLINFPKTNLQNSLFKGQNKLKLVMPCKGDEYVINEWLVYKIYNLLTPLSFKARLVKVTLQDEENKNMKDPFYAFILEDEGQVAARNKMIAINRKMQPEQADTQAFLIMSVFQYLIANTDWSIQFQQNIKLITHNQNGIPVAVPYDFDHAGLVEAPYAEAFEALNMRSIRERRYRGYCIKDLSAFTATILLFNSLKNDIYNLYLNCSLLDEKYKKRTIKFLDDFYETINNEKDWKSEFAYPCDPRGTGNVVIKGLKE